MRAKSLPSERQNDLGQIILSLVENEKPRPTITF